MPRDKTLSHEKIVAAAMKEFLQKGFEQASMKNIADCVGMTSAALYRHFDSKQAMFSALVKPAIDSLDEWAKNHVDSSYEMIQNGNTDEVMDFENPFSDSKMVLDVMYKNPDAFRLLLNCSAGTEFENFLHDKIEESTEQMMATLDFCERLGNKVRKVKKDEMHMLVTSYVLAMVQPIEHNYPREDAERYLRTIQEFFTPGWKMILGF